MKCVLIKLYFYQNFTLNFCTPILSIGHCRSGTILYCLMAVLSLYISLVVLSGAGPPLLQLNLIPKSLSMPPGLCEAVRTMPPGTGNQCFKFFRCKREECWQGRFLG